MKNWKIKLIEAVEAIVAIIGIILILQDLVGNPKGIAGLILIAIAALAFYITHNIALGRTFLGKIKEEKPKEEKK